VSADLSQITIPVWSIERQDIWPIHVRGPGETFRSLASNDKRLTIEVGDEFSKAYSPETVGLHQAFFNMHLGGKQAGDTELPLQPVTVEYRLPGGQSVTGYENEWPISRTQYVKYYLNASNPAGGTMSLMPPTPEAATTYSADVHAEVPNARLACSQYGVSFVSEPMTQDTTIAGYMKMGLWVSATATDMDIYATVRVLDEKGQEVFYNSFNSQKSPVSVGFLKASHRKQDPERATSYRPFMTHLASDYQPLVPGEKTQLEVEIWPATAVLKAGYRLLLNIQPYDGCFAAAGGPNGVYLHEYDATYHAGASNSIYTGGSEPSYLQIAVVPPKQ